MWISTLNNPKGRLKYYQEKYLLLLDGKLDEM